MHLLWGISKIFYKLDLIDTYLGVGLAHVAVCAPYAILILTTTFENIDDRVSQAAIVCGASPIESFFKVVLPMISPGFYQQLFLHSQAHIMNLH